MGIASWNAFMVECPKIMRSDAVNLRNYKNPSAFEFDAMTPTLWATTAGEMLFLPKTAQWSGHDRSRQSASQNFVAYASRLGIIS
jgi:hypothetical protein